MRNVGRFFAVVFVLGGVCAGVITPVTAQPVIHNVRVGDWEEIAAIVANQNCPNWCWAAASEMLVKSQGIFNVPQEEFVRRIYAPHLPGPVPPAPTVYPFWHLLPCLPTFGSFEPIRVAITGVYDAWDGSQVTLTGAYHYGVPTDVLGMIRSLQEGRPFIFAWQGHAWVAYGINYFYTGPSTIQFTEIELIDPLAQLSTQIPGGRPRPQFYSFVVGRDSFSDINGTFELFVNRQAGGAGGGGGAAGGGGAGGAGGAGGGQAGGGGGGGAGGGGGGAGGGGAAGGAGGDAGLGDGADGQGGVGGAIGGGDAGLGGGADGQGGADAGDDTSGIDVDLGAGDINGDGYTNPDDVFFIRALLGLCAGDVGFNPAADLNGDGCIDDRDLRLITLFVPIALRDILVVTEEERPAAETACLAVGVPATNVIMLESCIFDVVFSDVTAIGSYRAVAAAIR